MQRTLFVENTAVFLAGQEASAVLAQDGRKFHKPIISKPSTGTYTPYQDITLKNLSSTDELLEVNTFEYSVVEVDDTDVRQNFYDAAAHAAMSMQKQLNNRIEQAFLSRVTDANHTIDSGNLGGASGTPIQVSTANISALFSAAHTVLDVVDAPMAGRVAVVGAHTAAVMRDLRADRETPLGDTVLENGVVGPWKGWMVVQNNNLPYSARLGIATNPSNGDTVTIAGVTFKFVNALAAAGDVLIGGNAAASRANLVAAINGAAGAGTTYNEIGQEDRFILSEKRNVTATDNAGNNRIDLTGYGDIVVSETLTAAADVWSNQTQNSWFGIRGATDLAVQPLVSLEVTRKERGFADIVKSLQGYGVKTFADGARMLCNVVIDASSWV